MEVPFGTSLLAAEGDLWRTQRRCLAPAFAAKTVESFAAGTALAAAAAVSDG